VSLLSFARNTTLAVIFYGVPIAVPSTFSASEPDEDQLIDFASIIQITFEQNLEIAAARFDIEASEYPIPVLGFPLQIKTRSSIVFSEQTSPAPENTKVSA